MSYNTSYTPSEWVEWLSDRSRFDESSDITTFGADLDNSYGKGIAYNGAVFIILGVLVFLFVMFMYCCACCRCCCFSRKRKQQDGGHLESKEEPRGRCCRKFVFFVFTVVLLVGSAASAYLVSEMVSGGRDTTGAIDAASGILDTTTTSVTTLETQLGTTKTTATDWAAADAPRAGALASLIVELDAAIADAQAVTGSTEDLNEFVADASGDINNVLDNYEIGGWVYVSVSGVWALLVLFSLFFKSKCLFKTLMFFALFILVVNWVINGVVFATGIMAADACESPEDNVLELVDATPPFTDPNDKSASIFYYLYCAENTIADSGVVVTAADAQTALDTASSSLDAINCGADVTCQGFKDTATTNLADATTTMTGLVSGVSCTPVNDVWVQLRDGACDSTLEPLSQLWALQVVVSILMIVALLIAMPFWNDKAAPKKQKSNTDMQGVASPPGRAPAAGRDVNLV